MLSADHNVLPPEVRAALQRAAQAPREFRSREIDRVIDWAQTKYPEFFRQEVSHVAAAGVGQ